MFCPIRRINHGIIRPIVRITFFWQTDNQLYNQSFTTNGELYSVRPLLMCGYHGLTIGTMLIFIVLLFALAPSKPVIKTM